MEQEYSYIVVNKCYGGFGLSEEAIDLYLDLKGIVTYPEKRKTNTIFWLTPPSGNEEEDEYRDSFNEYQIKRNDPFLILVIQTLGEKANNESSKLTLQKLPKGTLYIIQEYDGMETIEISEKINWEIA